MTFALLVAAAQGRHPSQRELAAWAQVSLGTVNRVLRALRSDAGGVRYGWQGQGISPEGREVLAQDWMRAYLRTQPAAWPAKRFESARWSSPADVLHADLPSGCAIGSELAASAAGAAIRPAGALIYVPEDAWGAVLKSGRLRAAEAGMVELRTAFWSPELLDGARCTPPLLTRADLLLEDDPRLDDVAAQMKGQLWHSSI
ncbi:type IV toxin-antitoxin system AbiEi family antitoxin [Brevibacterium album]|uniref:type IV toxin-antitoxin system AbiEi family antitoxin n=1 Tax=Brevibacterium album TaxID=417948 RepID=UPI00146FBA55|nr:type IV toxin-antitoxin system AbiEi family antitoxin [Brevibacterium album]